MLVCDNYQSSYGIVSPRNIVSRCGLGGVKGQSISESQSGPFCNIDDGEMVQG